MTNMSVAALSRRVYVCLANGMFILFAEISN